MKKKLLFINFEMPLGGIERSLLGLLNTLDYSKYEVDLFLYRHSGDFLNQLPREVTLLPEHPTYQIFCGSIVGCFKRGFLFLGFIRIFAKIFTIIKNRLIGMNGGANSYCVRYYKWSIPFLPKFEKEYDVICSYQTPHFIALSQFKSDKKIGFIHTDYSTIDVDSNYETKMWKQLDHIVAISEECKNSFLSVLPKLHDKTTVVENILSDKFVRSQSLLIDVSNEISNDGSFKLVSVGRFCFPKAFDDAIRSAYHLKQKNINFKWYFIGFGPDEMKMELLIKEFGLEQQCFILGKKINPYPYMNSADLYVQPSRFEGKSVTVREAQMLMKPVLITNYPTAKSQIVDGIDGVICDYGVENVATAICDLIVNEELRTKLSKNCMTINFSNTDQLSKLEELFN